MRSKLDIAKLVKTVLINSPEAREDDYYLYLCVLRYVCNQEGESDCVINHMSVPFFLLHGYKQYPRFETVGRARRKVQELYPELRSRDEIIALRFGEQMEFEDFAKVKEIN